MPNRLESAEELKFVRLLESWAADEGIHLIALKLNLSGRRGWPDRMVMARGVAVFVEMKRKGGKPRKLQSFMHGRIRLLGFDVEVFDDADKAFKYVKSKILSSTVAT